MDNSGPEAMARQNLLERLLNSVKQVQVYFGARQEIATESDARVSALCVEWEMVLTHAARKPKPKNSLRLTGKPEGVSLWPLARLCVSAEDLQRFSRLNHVKAELGRGRAWLRAAINERTLENYMHTIISHEQELKKLYEVDAFLLDQERSSMLPIMAAGLSSIIFSISTDSSYLNNPSRAVEVPTALPSSVHAVEVPPTHLDSSVLPYPDTTAEDSFPSSYPSANPHLTSAHLSVKEADDDMIAISEKKKKKKQKKSKSRSPHLPSADITGNETVHNMSDKLPLKESTSSSSSRLSLDSVSDEGHAPMYVALTTSSDLISGEAMAAANATALVLSASCTPQPHPSPPHLAINSDPSNEQSSSTDEHVSHDQSRSPAREMRTAMLALSKMKDDLEVQNRALTRDVAELRVQVDLLQKQEENSQEDIDNMREAHSSQKQALEKENDLLREQLKKYVSIVQARRRESPSADSFTSSTSGNAGTPPSTTEDSLSKNTAESAMDTTADRKMQDMAEMYADLMELNERLHRNLADKDVTISSLVHLLRTAGIEVPQHQLPAAAMETKSRVRLVEVWIPSVIKKGRGPEGFHVYQVFVSVKGVEWNVYRRYTEFREFHRQLQKHLPEVAGFNFPPKKALGNKSTQVVEERRQRLQEYLRFVIKSCTKHDGTTKQRSEAILNKSISKETLVTIFPFFKEDFNQDPNPSPVPPSYSGL